MDKYTLRALAKLEDRPVSYTVEMARTLGLLPAADNGPYCANEYCNHPKMTLCASTYKVDGAYWRCNGVIDKQNRKKKTKCTSRQSLRKYTFFEASKLNIWQILYLIKLWTDRTTLQLKMITELGIAIHTAVDWSSYCREVVIDGMIKNSTRLGGPGRIVEIDESKFGKRKYHRGHLVEGAWVFGGIERRTGRIFLIVVPFRSAVILISVIKFWILPGTTIISDCWRAYDKLEEYGYHHLTVNHSKHYKDPITGAHSNSIESSWRHAKESIRTEGRSSRHLQGNLARYMFWKSCNASGKDALVEFSKMASALYTGHHTGERNNDRMTEYEELLIQMQLLAENITDMEPLTPPPSEPDLWVDTPDLGTAPLRQDCSACNAVHAENGPSTSTGRSANACAWFRPAAPSMSSDDEDDRDPRPRVTWYLENTIIDDSYEQRSDGLTVNSLSFPNVGRQHLNARLICQASNTNLAPPATKVLILDLNLKPIAVNILTKEKQVSADKRYEVECKTTGSRPEAVVTWWKGSRQIKRIAKNFSEANNVTLSLLTLVPTIDDDGKYLTCRAENPYIQDSAIEDKWRLNVHFMPVVTLKMGSNLNPKDIKEGDDVYFECNIRSNPKAYRLAWYHNGEEIHHNATAGVILSDQSLVLQSITKATAGDFTCLAANTEGKGTSNPVTLMVRYVPMCRERHDAELFGALKSETVAFICEVDANPPLVTFHWTFNNSGEQTDIAPRLYSSDGPTSRLNYTPTSDMDYGTLSCWGVNAVGHQKVPCMYQLVAAGRPFPLQNCSIANQSVDGIHVECLESFDGGLPQSFLMELLEVPSLKVKYNVSTNRTPPAFEISGLESGVTYRLDMYAVNAKGRSDPTTIETVTFKGQAKYIGQTTSLSLSPVLAGLIATAAILTTIVCVVIAALYRRHAGRGAAGLPTKHAPLRGQEHDQRSGSIVHMEHAVVLGAGGHGAGIHRPASPLDYPACVAAGGLPLLQQQGFNGSNGGSLVDANEDTDPDIIPNHYVDRRPISKGYMSLQRTPSQRLITKCSVDDIRSEPDGGMYTYKPKDLKIIQPANSYHSLGRANKGVTACNPLGSSTNVTSSLTMHRLRPEIVTTSNRIQESCI